MVDAHYDLLSICYVCYLKHDYTLIEKIKEEIETSGVKCIFANLYFMSKEEMINELHPNYYDEKVSILEMFKISKAILEKYLPNVDFIYSIEGCDYLDINDLNKLYNEGLRSILLVWNCENKYGSGNRTNKGLTKEGIEFLNRAIELGIGIDLSHANKPTFYGMIEVIKENQNKGKEVICYATHSNSRTLCNRERNLDDNQIKKIKEVGGLIGLISNRNFVTSNHDLSKEKQRKEYLKHIIYVEQLIGIDNIMLSTDDMRFSGEIDPVYYELPIFDYDNIVKETESALKVYYDSDDIDKIIYKNAYTKIVNKLRNNYKNNSLINKK